MDVLTAFQIVIELAKQNRITEFDDNADEMSEIIKDQIEAIKIIEDIATNEYGDN